MGEVFEIEVKESGRLDKVLSSLISQSRNQVAHLIEARAVEVDGTTITKPSFRLKVGNKITYHIIEAPKRESLSVDFDVEVLYEDEYLMVLNKPAGVVVHPAPSVREPTLVDWLIGRGISLSTIAGEERFGIVHRLDKQTSGALVIAKSNDVHQALSDELKRRDMGRFYLAIIDCPLRDDISVDAPIARNPHNRLKMGIVEGGRRARTDFLKLSLGKNGSELIAGRLHTGRTHQIRVHLESLNRHILGDKLYGYKDKQGKIPRVFLHASLLYLTHPISKKRLEVIAPLPKDMQKYLSINYLQESFEQIESISKLPQLFLDKFLAIHSSIE